jgi:hypothetical protein
LRMDVAKKVARSLDPEIIATIIAIIIVII